MNVLVSAATIRKSILMHGGRDYSLEAINHVAQDVCGYKIRHIGALRGYHKSIFTELQRHWKELNEYEDYVQKKKAQKANKQQKKPSFNQNYNPDKFIEPDDRKDYTWELEESNNAARKTLTVLWVDDQREPYKYLNTKSKTNTFLRNKQFYDSLGDKFNLNFVWVKNLYQFIEYIEKNGVPDFISFDHDLNNRGGGEGLSDEEKIKNNGLNCAKWLIEYCKNNRIHLPKFYVHSANPKHGPEIVKALSLGVNEAKTKKIHINENQLSILGEDVFVSDLKRNKAKLTYNKRSSDKAIRNLGNYNSFDMLNTVKMDQNNADTFIIPLKGGINSYNITSIKGTEVMHYFKNKFENKTTNIDIKVNGEKSKYELMMEDSEFKDFIKMFSAKVSNVVNYVSKTLASNDKNFEGFKGVSIYPVPSSSNFNESMSEILEEYNIGISGLPCRKVNKKIFEKNLSNLQKDNDFINKNKEYYNSRYFKGGDDNSTHIDKINDTIRKYNNTTLAQDQKLIDEYNKWIKRVITSYRTNVSPKKLALNYQNLVKAKNEIRKKLGKSNWDKAFKQIKYAKGPSVDERTKNIQAIVASVLGKTYVSQNQIDIVEISKKDFQIKTLSNDIRLGLKNYFKAKDDIEDELAQIKGTVFVIFDDNISGGATLSDICYQAKKLGIKYIIPITFGEMRVKYTQGVLSINKPKNDFTY